jgi:hypothetical protein
MHVIASRLASLYSFCNAVIVSIRVARHAGTPHAAIAIRIKKIVTKLMVHES